MVSERKTKKPNYKEKYSAIRAIAAKSASKAEASGD